MTGPLRFPPPDKRVPPAPAVPASPSTAKSRTRTAREEQVTELVGLVSASRLRATVETLAALPTRHTLSPHIHQAADLITAEYTADGHNEVV